VSVYSTTNFPITLRNYKGKAWAFQLKGQRSQDHYSTLAVFDSESALWTFVSNFPRIPACTIRVIDQNGGIVYRLRYGTIGSNYESYSLRWMIDQSEALVRTVNKGNDILDQNFNEFLPNYKSIKLPKFSLKSIARKTLRSFIK